MRPLSSQRPVGLTLTALGSFQKCLGAARSPYITGVLNTYMYRTISDYVYYIYIISTFLHKFQCVLSSDPPINDLPVAKSESCGVTEVT